MAGNTRVVTWNGTDLGGEFVHRLVAVFGLPLLEQLGDDDFRAGHCALRRRYRI